MGRYIEKDDPKAEEMFERLIGYSYATSTYEETHAFMKHKGSQVRLTKEPVEIESCQGYLIYEPMKVKTWVDIPLDTLIHNGRVLDVPPSIFGVPFAKVKITFRAGEQVIPQDIKEAIEDISSQLANPNVSTWNLPLSPNTLLTVQKYRKNHERG